MLSLRHFSVRRGAFTLGPIDLELGRGQVLGLAGDSGSGKSTLFDGIAGLIDPLSAQNTAQGPHGKKISGGEICMDGCAMSADVPPHRRGVAYLMQDLGLWENASAMHNVQLVLDAHASRLEAGALLASLGFDLGRRDKVGRLSGGERKRVALARVLACPARLVLLDEPGAHLDRASWMRIASRMREHCQAMDAACVVASHQMDELMAYQPDRIAVLEDGKLARVEATGNAQA